MSREYTEYLTNHKNNVAVAFRWLKKYMPCLFEGMSVEEIKKVRHDICIRHDHSKIDDEEYLPYDEYFYGKGEKSEEVIDNFNKAWLMHIHKNPHHWQYWVLLEDGGVVKAIPMPEVYILEMLCDWWSFSWSKGNLYEIFDWYEKNKYKMIMHNITRNTVEHILRLLGIAILEYESRKEENLDLYYSTDVLCYDDLF